MDKSKKTDRKFGLEEAVHPEIGNESAWEENLHDLNLRAADPLKKLDQHLLDPADFDLVLAKWKNQFSQDGHQQSVPGEQFEPIPLEDVKQAEEKKELIPEIPVEEVEAEEAEETEKAERKKGRRAESKINESEEEFVKEDIAKEEKKVKATKATKPGKRIRKVADKVKKEETEKWENTQKMRGLKESSLSPFTRWVKGLMGSEYVHPYEADYAIEKGSEPGDEGISETFADLLASQGYKDQAIAMYTKLIEKFPEKSSFFAAKIKALQP